MSSGDERDDESRDLGFAQTATPAAGIPVVAGPTPQPQSTQESEIDIDRPESDKLQRAVARQRVAGKLFAKKPPEAVKLGRYHLLETVGSGGMGVVWGAWDPELDRRVAIKLVKAEMQAARDRILIEGQALAKLSHPNVIPIYDVGVVDEQVYLVMEWVRGKNLRAWLKQPRTVRDVVAVYRASGEGLSAAHRVGLIHRDFKPDNAMIGDDGRVRVLDFGLARGEVKAKSKPKAVEDKDSLEQFSSDLTRGAGTPRYMPPEQAEGAELSPAVDQYALGVSLREALVGRNADGKDADVPRWLDEIIDRATAREPSNRYASMDELLYELTHDPRTVWRRRGIVAGALALAGTTFIVGTVRGGSQAKAEQCGGGAEAIAATWQPKIRDAMTAHLQTLGPYAAEEAKRLVGDMSGYSSRWAGMHRSLCLAHERKESTPQLYEIRLNCLARAQAAFDTIVKVLTRVETERLENAILAARALPDITQCAQETSSSTVEPPGAALKERVAALSNRVEQVRFLALAMDPSATEVATAAAAEADKLAYPPAIAKANLMLGMATIGDGQGAALAIPPLERATSTALAAGDFITFVEAYAREAHAAAFADPKDLPKNTTNFEATTPIAVNLAKALRAEGAFARTLLYNNLGTARLAVGDTAGARSWFETALAEPQNGKRNLELWVIYGNLALTLDDPARRTALFAEQKQHLERELGENHAFVLDELAKAALFVEDAGKAAAQLRDVCTRMEKWHPHRKQRGSECWFELAWLAEERGDDAETRHAAQKSNDSARGQVSAAYLLILDGKLEQAITEMMALGDKLAKDPFWYSRFLAIDAYFAAVSAQLKAKHTAAATMVLRKMLAILDSPDFPKSATYYTRRLARVHALLAKLLPPAEAKPHAKTAADWYRAAGGYEALVAELDAITGSR